MTQEEVKALALAHIRVFTTSSQKKGTPTSLTPQGETISYAYQAGFRKALELVMKDLFDPADKELLEEDQVGYRLLDIQRKYQDLLK